MPVPSIRLALPSHPSAPASRSEKPGRLSSALAGLLSLAFATPALANTTPIATDDSARHNGEVVVVDVLANDLEPDGEALTVTIGSSTCNGTLSEDLGLVTLLPAAPTSENCTIEYTITDERAASASAVVQVLSSGLLFKDGFESGDPNAWSDQESQAVGPRS